MANPSGNHQELEQNHASYSFSGGNLPDGYSGTVPVPKTSSTAMAMKHNPGISKSWSAKEQAILEGGLSNYASESNIIRYAKIAMLLQNKTVRDVALRCRWMTKKEISKRRKEGHNLSRKSKDKMERVSKPSAQLAARPNVAPYAPPMLPTDFDDGISCEAIDGPIGDLLDINDEVLNQISANMANFQIQESLALFGQLRDSIVKIMNIDLSNMPEVMKHMPPFPEKVNEELANAVLSHPSHQMQS